MPKKKKQNPDFSPTIQHLLDLVALGKGEYTVESLLKEIKTDKALQTQCDKLWDYHQYPDRALTYVKSSNYNNCRARYEISSNANMALTLFEHIANQTGLFQIAVADIKKYAFKDSICIKTVRRAMTELIENGFIAVHTEQTGTQATIYMLNPAIAKSGKPVSKEDTDKFNDLIHFSDSDNVQNHPLLKFENLQKRKNNVSIIVQKYKDPATGQVEKINSLHVVLTKEKEPLLGQADDSQEYDPLFTK